MVISSAQEYVEFFINLKMGNEVSLLRFVNNERMVLKGKLQNKINEKEPLKKGIMILEGLIKEIGENGESVVLQKYQTKG